MEQIRRGWAALRENRRSGLSLIFALIACAVLLGLTLSLIYAASVPLARANRKIGQERCRQLACSFAEVLDTDLRQYTAERADLHYFATDTVWTEVPANRAPARGDTFYSRVNSGLESYTDYDPADPATVYRFSVENPVEGCDKLEVKLRKTDFLEDPAGARWAFRDDIEKTNETVDGKGYYGCFSYGVREESAKAAELNRKFIRYHVQVDVAASLESDAFLRSAEYYREDCYRPCYTWHVVNLDKLPAGFDRYQPLNGTSARQPGVKNGLRVRWEQAADGRWRFVDEGGIEMEEVTWYWDEPIYDEGSAIIGYFRHTWPEEVTIGYVYYEETLGGKHVYTPTYQHYVPAYEADQAEGGGP